MDDVHPVHPALGRRAKATQDALHAASQKVIKTLTAERVGQCFVTYKDQYPELMAQVQALMTERYNEGIQRGWELMTAECDFVNKANSLDKIEEEAKGRKARGQTPGELYLKGADAHVTIPNATAPVLNEATRQIREKRAALQAKNEATYVEIAKNQTVASRIEQQIVEIIADFQESMTILESVDTEGIADLEAKLVEAVPQEF